MVKDIRGLEVSAGDAGAVETLDRAIDGYLTGSSTLPAPGVTMGTALASTS